MSLCVALYARSRRAILMLKLNDQAHARTFVLRAGRPACRASDRVPEIELGYAPDLQRSWLQHALSRSVAPPCSPLGLGARPLVSAPRLSECNRIGFGLCSSPVDIVKLH